MDSETKIKQEIEENLMMGFERIDQSPTWLIKEGCGADSSAVKSSPSWSKGLTQDDINSIYQLGALSTKGIVAEVQKIYEQAFLLGCQESKVVARGKQLDVFTNARKKH